MINRIWHGWTTPANADAYEHLLLEEIIPGIEARHVIGFNSIQVLRRDGGDEVEFVTIMSFDSLAAVKEFAGDDYEAAYVPDEARKVLARFDERSLHYEVKTVRWSRGGG